MGGLCCGMHNQLDCAAVGFEYFLKTFIVSDIDTLMLIGIAISLFKLPSTPFCARI